MLTTGCAHKGLILFVNPSVDGETGAVCETVTTICTLKHVLHAVYHLVLSQHRDVSGALHTLHALPCRAATLVQKV